MRRLVPLILVTMVLAACGGGTSGLLIVGSSPQTIGVGPQRIITAWVDDEQSPLGGPDQEVDVLITRGGETYTEVPGQWVWSIEGVRGYYVAYVDFDQPGTYEATIQPAEGSKTPPTTFEVLDVVGVPEIGQLPPASITKTYPDTPLAELSSDPDPNPAFHEKTVADVIGSGKPGLIVFASPAFCQTAVCGPTLDIVEKVAAAHPDLQIVHVEVYDNLDAAGVNDLRVVPAVDEWGFASEPWVYVLDSGGRVAARFEGAVAPEEIEDVLSFVMG
jgi:hypothetical protein